ncbi:MAG TPA: methionyl-tRNA formyltransferase [Chthoniobacterales bacterium]|jgi:methionyl-tRNA formyltransferase|nr:methionyl-tRNA formyltransferase [Chthoniobacterales bacterium]
MRVLFIGTGEIGVPVLRWLIESKEHELVGIVTQPDKPVGREQRIEAPPIKIEAAGTALPILQPKRIKNSVAEIQALKPDLIVVMAYGQILPRTVLEIPLIACLNLHASLLPRHRGAAPIQAAIVAGDRETGISVMFMDEGLDTGHVLLQKRIEIAPDETGGSLHDRLAEIAPAALNEALIQLQRGTAVRTPQDSSAATYAPKLEREHGRIDWHESAALIERKIRAFNPWPGAFAILRDDASRERKLKIFQAHVAGKSSGEPLSVPAKDEALVLDEVQLEGKRRMSAEEFLRGYHAPVQFA